MEAHNHNLNQLLFTSSEPPDKYSRELEVVVGAVQMACLLCQTVQESLISKFNDHDHVQLKDDKSPVTIAEIDKLLPLPEGRAPVIFYETMRQNRDDPEAQKLVDMEFSTSLTSWKAKYMEDEGDLVFETITCMRQNDLLEQVGPLRRRNRWAMCTSNLKK